MPVPKNLASEEDGMTLLFRWTGGVMLLLKINGMIIIKCNKGIICVVLLILDSVTCIYNFLFFFFFGP